MKEQFKEVQSKALLNTLVPLLDALGWDGDDRTLLEARPYLQQELDESGLENTMANLGYSTQKVDSIFSKLDHRLIPALFLSKKGNTYLVTATQGASFFVYDGLQGSYREIVPASEEGRYLFFKEEKQETYNPMKSQKGWSLRIMTRFRGLFIVALILSMLLTFTALLTPLTVMSIYNILSGANSISSLAALGVGIILFMSADFGFRWFRLKLLNYAGARTHNIVSNQVLRRIFYLPPSFTETASLGSQIARIRDFNSVRAFIEGAGMTSLLDFPFFIILFIALIIIGGELAYIPAVAAILMILFGVTVIPWVKKINEESALSMTKKQEFLIEFLNSFAHIRFTGASALWKKRYQEISADAAIASYKTANINATINTISQGIVSMAGAITIGMGVLGVMNGTLTTGALLGSMMLVWRILAPIKSGFSVLSQSTRIKKSLVQLDRLMQMPTESSSLKSRNIVEQVKGRIRFLNVSIRYNNDSAPALLGINLDIKSGEMIAITGHDGAGKSTLLKLILGMYKPQSGRVLIDHINIQQLNPLTARRSIAYTPQADELFYGTIEQNLKLANPLMTNIDMEEATQKAGIYGEIMDLPREFSERLGDQFNKRISSSFTKRISLARMFALNSPILLLDEPERGLDASHIEHLKQSLEGEKGRKTVLLVTNHPELIAVADRKITLDRGRLQE